MACGEVNRLHRRTIDLVFPLGATVNMDGSTIYYVQAVIFMSASAAHPLHPYPAPDLCVIYLFISATAVVAH
jgi:Na+/H+-dicarboxylate symporter